MVKWSRADKSPFTNSRGRKIKVTIDIPDWLEKFIVFFILLYRRLRFGYAFRKIPLTQGKFAIVDPDDYQRLAKYKWHASKANGIFYAARCQYLKSTKKLLTIQMHRLIIDVPQDLVVDHINHNGLDNRKVNLRPATRAENTRNARRRKVNTSSKYNGVWFATDAKRWRAAIKNNGKREHIGYFDNEITAAKAYDRAAKKYHGAFAVLNFDGK